MLPDQSQFEESMYRAQRFIVVRGHAQEAGLPNEGHEAYEFNMKIDLSACDIDSQDAKVKQAVKDFFDKSLEEGLKIWSWAVNGKQVGRSGGWLVVDVAPPGFKEWVAAYNDTTEVGQDEKELIWMSIQRRLDDLDAIVEFIADQQETLKQELPDLVKGVK